MADATEPERKGPSSGTQVEVHVWDLPLRIFKWSFATLIMAAWLTGENGNIDNHEKIGIAIIALVLFRVAWGIIGGEHARFWNFVRGPGAIIGYARGLLSGKAPLVPGHNPLGALSVIALLGLGFAQAFTGLFNTDDILFEGPLYPYAPGWFSKLMGDLHHTIFDLLLIVIGLHIAAVLTYVAMRKDILGPMITGKGRYSAEVEPRHARGGSVWLGATVAAVIVAGVVFTYLSV